MAQRSTRTIETVRRLHIPPFVAMPSPTFARHYAHGLASAMEQSAHPLQGVYLADIFTLARRVGYCDGQHEETLEQWMGFALGEIHGAVVRKDGTLRPQVGTLVTLDEDEETRRGYRAGREYFFLVATNDQERVVTEEYLIERLHELAEEYEQYQRDAEATVRFALGDVLGHLSGQLFPWTGEEQRAFEAECIRHVGSVCPLPTGCLAARQRSVLTPSC